MIGRIKYGEITLVLILTYLIYSCKSDPLPQYTQNGSNVLGCLIDDKAFIPDGGPPFSGSKPIYGGFLVINPAPIELGVYIHTNAKSSQKLDLYLDNIKLGRHFLANNVGVLPANIRPNNYGLYTDSNGDEYVTSSQYTGWIDLNKADTATGVVAGTFEFKAANKQGKAINITKGRFDVNYRTL